jgi:hypothetical protein
MDARNFVQHANRVLLLTLVPMDAIKFIQHANRVLLFILVPMDARNFIHNANSHTSLDVKRCILSIAKK